jgi:hypothetical protein
MPTTTPHNQSSNAESDGSRRFNGRSEQSARRTRQSPARLKNKRPLGSRARL